MLICGFQSRVEVLGWSRGRTVLVRGSMQLKRSGFNDGFLNLKLSQWMVWMQEIGMSGSSSAMHYYINYSPILHLQHLSTKKDILGYFSQLILIVNTPGKDSLFLGTTMAPKMIKKSWSCWNINQVINLGLFTSKMPERLAKMCISNWKQLEKV